MRMMKGVGEGMRPLARWLQSASGRDAPPRRAGGSGAASRTRLLSATRTLLGMLATAAPERELLQAGIEALMELMQVRYGAICMFGEAGALQHFVYAGLGEEEAGRIVQPPAGNGLLGAVVRDNSIIRLDSISRDRRSAGFPDHHPPMTTLLAIPVSCLDRVYGRIYLCDKIDGRAFSDEDEELASSFANALSLAVDNERRLAELKRKQDTLVHSAFHDPLTNLPNRALLADRIGQVLSRAHRNRAQAAVLFCDLDDFKIVNDTLGHQAGDHVLRTVSERLLNCVREEDTVARIGGDEFVFVLSEVESVEQVGVVAQKILDVMAQGIAVGEREIVLSGSVGIAVFPQDGHASEHLICNADAAMYRAKASGKNRFRFFSEAARQGADAGPST